MKKIILLLFILNSLLFSSFLDFLKKDEANEAAKELAQKFKEEKKAVLENTPYLNIEGIYSKENYVFINFTYKKEIILKKIMFDNNIDVLKAYKMLNSKEFLKHISEERQYRWKKYLCEPVANYLRQGVLLNLQLSWDDNNEYITNTLLDKNICNLR